MAYLWHLWPGRGWPLLAHEESALVERWAEADQGQGVVRRDALIVALGGIRCGSTADDLAEAAPGVTAADLLASYQHLDLLRREAHEAYMRMCSAEDPHSFRRAAKAAARLVPAPSEMLRTTVRLNGFERLPDAARRVLHREALVRREVEDIYLHLPRAADPVQLGRILFDPYNSGLWGDPYFAAARVGELTPVRVRTLLGEDAHSDLIFTDVHEMGGS